MGCKERHCCPDFSDVLMVGGIVCILQNQVFNFHEALFLQEDWLMLLLIHTLKLPGRVIMQKSLGLVGGFPHDKRIRLLECLPVTDHPVPWSVL